MKLGFLVLSKEIHIKAAWEHIRSSHLAIDRYGECQRQQEELVDKEKHCE
jgi:hypothetical protein